jgi:mannose-6-phosphate isomerase-like protein (cupin superfamily)
MIRKSEEKTTQVKEGLFGASGEVTIRSILNDAKELYNKGRVFAHTSLAPGASIGYHLHEEESETYYILSGEALYNDNGKEFQIFPGDVTHTPPGEGHGITNIGKEELHLIALILNK